LGNTVHAIDTRIDESSNALDFLAASSGGSTDSSQNFSHAESSGYELGNTRSKVFAEYFFVHACGIVPYSPTFEAFLAALQAALEPSP